jgi:hypothetical protein
MLQVLKTFSPVDEQKPEYYKTHCSHGHQNGENALHPWVKVKGGGSGLRGQGARKLELGFGSGVRDQWSVVRGRVRARVQGWG